MLGNERSQRRDTDACNRSFWLPLICLSMSVSQSVLSMIPIPWSYRVSFALSRWTVWGQQFVCVKICTWHVLNIPPLRGALFYPNDWTEFLMFWLALLIFWLVFPFFLLIFDYLVDFHLFVLSFLKTTTIQLQALWNQDSNPLMYSWYKISSIVYQC